MTREEKTKKRIERSKLRRKKRMAAYVKKIKAVEDRPMLTLSQGLNYASSWPDSNSPTGYSQYCEWPAGSICQSPCNGDC